LPTSLLVGADEVIEWGRSWRPLSHSVNRACRLLARNGSTESAGSCPLIGADRKWHFGGRQARCAGAA